MSLEEETTTMNAMPVPVGEWFRCEESEGSEGVEVKFSVDGRILLQDWRDRSDGPVLEFIPQMWEAFVRGIHQGEFDRPPTSMFDRAITNRCCEGSPAFF